MESLRSAKSRIFTWTAALGKPLWIGLASVNRMERQWIIYIFFMTLLEILGLCPVCLGFNGSCQEWQLNYFIAGKDNSVEIVVVLLEKWIHTLLRSEPSTMRWKLNICCMVATAFLLWLCWNTSNFCILAARFALWCCLAWILCTLGCVPFCTFFNEIYYLLKCPLSIIENTCTFSDTTLQLEKNFILKVCPSLLCKGHFLSIVHIDFFWSIVMPFRTKTFKLG